MAIRLAAIISARKKNETPKATNNISLQSFAFSVFVCSLFCGSEGFRIVALPFTHHANRFSTPVHGNMVCLTCKPIVSISCLAHFSTHVRSLRKLHSTSPVMVEGHSVHRVAFSHSRQLVGKRFAASSPNGRFTEGAKAIDGKKFHSIEAVGKNLFAFFGDADLAAMVCVHVHFGMSGAWSVFDRNLESIPEVNCRSKACVAVRGSTNTLFNSTTRGFFSQQTTPSLKNAAFNTDREQV